MNRVTTFINGQEVTIAFDESSIHIYNAFPIKEDLKQRGYRWNPMDKSWFSKPQDVEAEMIRLQEQGQVSRPNKGEVRVQEERLVVAGLPESLSVSELRNRLDRLIREGIRGNIWVRGVIASDVKNYKWSSYLDLRDEEEGRDIFFRMEVKKEHLGKITRKLVDSGVAVGLERDLPVFCNVEVYLPLRNVVDIRLMVLDILPEYTQSKLRNQREVTLEKLRAEGLIDKQKQLLMPLLITRIGLITSEQGTSIRDIQAGLFPCAGHYDFYFVDSRMEGVHAVETIIQALDFLEERYGAELDAIIIARGGGSEQSLAVFNDLTLCRRVCRARIPIITAIGHEKDLSAIECCSWLTPTPATPSGVGKYLQNRYLNLEDRLARTLKQLLHHFNTRHGQEMERLKFHLRNVPVRASALLRQREERFLTLTRGVGQSIVFTVRDHGRRLQTQVSHLLRRGRELRQNQHKNVVLGVATVLARLRTLHARELKQVEKTMLRLDFGKRDRDHSRLGEELSQRARAMLELGRKLFDTNSQNLRVRQQLVRAADPENILKKGFTLTLDSQNRVVKSLHQFKQLAPPQAVLRFFDGSTDISPARRDVGEATTTLKEGPRPVTLGEYEGEQT